MGKPFLNFKGYSVELVEMRFNCFPVGVKPGHFGEYELRPLLRGTEKLPLNMWFHAYPDYPFKDRPNTCPDGYTQPFDVYQFHILSTHPYGSVLRDEINEHGAEQCFGPGTIFWEPITALRKQLCGDAEQGVVVMGFATTPVRDNEDDWHWEYELVGPLQFDAGLVIANPMLDWYPNHDLFTLYTRELFLTNSHEGLKTYLTDFD